ncbi:FabD/lysophospholipase-like protein [Ascodesmis nigricans]|uniref:FabD/lysophospholipase-like protein n=1 Tax=Ascodesmis nigricans TaxID=341454 RepID=A0A4S2MJ29_9PEZI|nr:FabD/lysophospholipase-like protein [Ascodesmis nigricans]
MNAAMIGMHSWYSLIPTTLPQSPNRPPPRQTHRRARPTTRFGPSSGRLALKTPPSKLSTPYASPPDRCCLAKLVHSSIEPSNTPNAILKDSSIHDTTQSDHDRTAPMNANAFAGYDYNPSTGTYTKNPNWRPSPVGSQPSLPLTSASSGVPPPRPPKEPASNADGQIIKESQYDSQAAELDSEPRYSMDSLTQQTLQQLQLQAAPTAPAGPCKARILSLDGGGIRGYSTLIILQELMHQVYVYTHNGKGPKTPADLPRPCDYFDLIAGNGTGGLIALMLGRMRMNVETCKETYVSLTRFVFITDKTLLGMPYGKTLFKASRLEEAIKYCVESATRFDHLPIIPGSPPPDDEGSSYVRPSHRRSDSWRRHRRESNSSLGTISGRTSRQGGYESGRSSSRLSNSSGRGSINAPLLDSREGACRTFVTAMLKGSRKNTPPVLLRSYPSSAESVASYKTTIWEAGRATCATAQAFKPITIDQTTFLDEGFGRYNPAFEVLEEVREHEFPDAHICPFVSIGTGKRPKSQIGTESRREWWEGVAFDEFAEAKRRLIRRTDDCERVHRELVDGIEGGRPRLAKSGVAAEDYYRFNVEVGVGEFGMNEWNRLADVATGTRRYLAQRETARFVKECAMKLVEAGRAPKQAQVFPSVQMASQLQKPQKSSPPLRPRTPSEPIPPHQIPAPRPPVVHQQQQPSSRPSPPAMDEKEVFVGSYPGPIPAAKPPQYTTPPPGQPHPYARPPPALPPQAVQRYNNGTHQTPPPSQHPAYQPPYAGTPPQQSPYAKPPGRPNDPPYPEQSPFPVLPQRNNPSQPSQPQQAPPPRPPLPPGIASASQSQQQPPPPAPQAPKSSSPEAPIPVATMTPPGQTSIIASKPGKVVLPQKPVRYGDNDDTPNPEIRVTSPTTVAGGSDDEEEEGVGRRRRRRLRSRSRGTGLDEIDE